MGVGEEEGERDGQTDRETGRIAGNFVPKRPYARLIRNCVCRIIYMLNYLRRRHLHYWFINFSFFFLARPVSVGIHKSA